MASLFISYSRKDIEVARKLTEAFEGQKLDFWIDWEGIPPSVDWWREIEKGIEEADIFLFLLSPDSVNSNPCRKEIEHAFRNGKRLIPVVVRDIKTEESPSELSLLNWVFIREKDDFDKAFRKLIAAIKTDYEWVQVHRRLQVRALEWDRGNRDNSFLLRGKDLQYAEAQLVANAGKDPKVTELQTDYVLRSRQVSDRQRNITTGVAIAGVLTMTVLAIFAFVQANLATSSATDARNQAATAQAESIRADANAATAIANEKLAEERAKIALGGELAAKALVNDQPFLSFLYSAESIEYLDNYAQRNSLLTSLQASPSLRTILHGHQASVWSTAFSPDGNTLAAGSADGKITLWNVSLPSKPVQLDLPLDSHTDNVWSVAFSPNSEILAAGTGDHKIVFWEVSNTATPRQLGEPITGHADNVRSVAFSPDSNLLASAGCGIKNDNICIQGEIILWDVSNIAEPVQLSEPLSRHTGDVQIVAFSPDGQILASASWDNTVILWDVSNPTAPIQLGDPLQTHTLPVLSVAFSSDNETLATGSMDNTIILWDISNPANPVQRGAPLTDHADEVWSLAFSPDGNTLASASADHKIIVWDTTNPNEPILLVEPLTGHTNLVLSVAFSPDGNTLASGSVDQTVILWDVPNPAPPIRLGAPLRHTHAVWSLAFSPSGNTLAAGTYDRTIVLWELSDITTPLQLANLTRHAGPVWSIAYSDPGDKILASAGCGKASEGDCVQEEIILWDVSNPSKPMQLGEPFSGHTNDVQSVAFSPDGKVLATASWDHTIILWDVSNPAKPHQLSDPLIGHSSIVRSVAFSPDGKILASSSDDLTVILWDVTKPSSPLQVSQLPNRHTNWVWTTAFSPDGKILASGSLDTTVILWDISNPAAPFQLGEPLSHTDYVWSIAFSPDGRTLASTSCGKRNDNNECTQGEITLWSVINPAAPLRLGKPLLGHTNEVLSVTFSPDSRVLASGSLDNTVIFWDVDPKSWAIRACQKAGRNFTREEWDQTFPNESYHTTCPQWPAGE